MSAGGQNSKKSSSAPSDPSAVVEHTRHLLSISLADSTKKMYGVGWRSYIQYCTTANRKPLPLSEEALMNWASSTALSGCKYTTIKSYLSGIRSCRYHAGLRYYRSSQDATFEASASCIEVDCSTYSNSFTHH